MNIDSISSQQGNNDASSQSKKQKQDQNPSTDTAFASSGPVTEGASGNQVAVQNVREVRPNEAPVTSAMSRGADSAATANAPGQATTPQPGQPHTEDILNITNIQGNILPGFLKDHQTLIFLRIVKGEDDSFRKWLGSLEPSIATVDEVLSFNRAWKKVHHRRGENKALQATWINIAFSFNALKRLTKNASQFKDASFRAGLAAHSASLNDPTANDAEGSAKNWLIGGPNNEADVILIVAADDRDDMLEEVARIEDTIFAPRNEQGQPVRSGVEIIFKQVGATLPPPLTGHEHFGFKDGVSQPGIRGRLSNMPNDFLTPRQNPDDRDQGKPGQDLLWPGEFVFGYHGQSADKDIKEPGDVSDAGPKWGKDGSFLVFRRLRQDVAGFHSFLKTTATQHGISAARLGAKCVGRWESGAPILRGPLNDDIAMAGDDCANNHFEFVGASQPISTAQSGDDCTDTRIPQSAGDQHAAICPFAGHIRKAYPRDDERANPPVNEEDTQTHRLLRRGIPFGEPLNEKPDAPFHDSGNRGLLFMAYQTSIVDQFEFVTKNWVNNPDFLEDHSGHDPILGQAGGNGTARRRKFKFQDPDVNGGQAVEVTLEQDWVIPTGGGYFFAPSIDAIKGIATKQI